MVSPINNESVYQRILIANLTQSMQDQEQKAQEAQKNLDAEQSQESALN